MRAAPARNFFVDVLRGLSILLVMLLHFGPPSWADLHLPTAATKAIASGYYGVTVFFVISGYLIASTSIRRFGRLSDMDIGTFAKFRFGRIVPFLLLVVALLLSLGRAGAVDFAFTKNHSLVDAAAAVLSLQFNDWYLHNVSAETVTWSVMWSLSIEELFYVFFPIVCRMLRSKAMLVGWLLMSLPFCFYTRAVNPSGLFLFSGCADALCIGVLIAVLADDAPGRESLLLSLLGMAASLAGIFYVCWLKHPSANAKWGPLLCAGFAGAFIYSSLFFPKLLVGGGAPSRLMTLAKVLGMPLVIVSLLGRCSYEAYLLHMPAFKFVTNYVSPNHHKAALLVLVGVVSFLMNTFFTEPMNRIIRDGQLPAGPRTWNWKRLRVPAFVAAALLLVPQLIVLGDKTHPTSVVSATTTVNRSGLRPLAAPLFVYGEFEDAEFISVGLTSDGSVQLQFDHWGNPPVNKRVSSELVKGDFSVSLDCKAPAVLIGGVPVFTKEDLVGFSSHDELTIGRNDIRGNGIATTVEDEIQSSTIAFNTGATSPQRHWRRGE